MKIIIHSSKTMKPTEAIGAPVTIPQFLEEATSLSNELRGLSLQQICQMMQISPKLGKTVQEITAAWYENDAGWPAALTFRGDIYSGLQAGTWSPANRAYAQQHLLIMSGMYGLLRPFDLVKPYRLEMSYPLKPQGYKNLVDFWSDKLSVALDSKETYINLTAYEYYRAIEKHLAQSRVISPKFLTINKTGVPTFVTVHAKIARGAFAHWLIVNNIQDASRLVEFDGLNYAYTAELSTPLQPTFVTHQFDGIGLSVRLQ